MKSLFWLLALFALAVVLTLAAHNPGYVLFSYSPYRVEMSLSLFVVGVIALFTLGYFSVRLFFAALDLPAYVKKFRDERAHAKAASALSEALEAFFEGRYAAAEKSAVQALDLGEKSAITPILAARAAHELREFSRRDAYLARAEAGEQDSPVMRLLAVAKFSLDEHQPKAALAALKELRETGAKGHVGELHLELKAERQAQNWDAVLELVRQLEKRNAIDKIAADLLGQQAWLEKIRAERQDLQALQAVWKNVPGEFKRRGRIASAAARAFMHLQDYKAAREILAEGLNAQWDGELAQLYGDCIVTDGALSQIEEAERWLKSHPDDAGLLLSLGKLCLHQNLWGKAQNYLEASVSVAESRDAYNALGQLAERLYKPDEAFLYFRKAMRLVGNNGGGEVK
jgi:HemY protein